MCNNYELHIAWEEYCAMMQRLALATPPGQSAADLPQADQVRINDIAPVIRRAEEAGADGVELAPMRFGFPRPKPKASPLFNFRSEGRHFDASHRCLIPASAFFEFTGTKYPKAKHRFTLAGEPFLAIAGIWREGAGNQPPAFTMLTTAPGTDVKPYHDRQMVVLPPAEWSAWLDLAKPEEALLRPLPQGALQVETVREGAENGGGSARG